MSLIDKIFNVGLGRKAAGPGTVASPSMMPGSPPESAAAGKSLEELGQLAKEAHPGYSANPPAVEPTVEPDEYTKKWGHLRGRSIYINDQMRAEIIKHGNLEPKKEAMAKKLLPLCEHYQKVMAEHGELNTASIQIFLQKIHQENEEHVKAGRHESIREIPSKQRLEEEYLIRRKVLQDKKRALAISAAPIQDEFMVQFEKATRSLVEKLEAEEKAECERWGVQHTPSLQLISLAWLGLEGCRLQMKHRGDTNDPAHVAPGILV